VPADLAKQALEKAMYKLPVKAKFVQVMEERD
jgi:ribosomal protein L16/L10AE